MRAGLGGLQSSSTARTTRRRRTGRAGTSARVRTLYFLAAHPLPSYQLRAVQSTAPPSSTTPPSSSRSRSASRRKCKRSTSTPKVRHPFFPAFRASHMPNIPSPGCRSKDRDAHRGGGPVVERRGVPPEVSVQEPHGVPVPHSPPPLVMCVSCDVLVYSTKCMIVHGTNGIVNIVSPMLAGCME